jgi:hypothetical protein
MMNEHQQLTGRLRMANPVPDPAQPPFGADDADVVLLEIERRSTTVQTTDRTTQHAIPPQRRWSGAWAAVAAFAAVIIVIAGLIILFGANDTEEPVATTTTEVVTTTTVATTTTLSASELEALLASEAGLPQGSIRQLEYGRVDLPGAVPLSMEIPVWNDDPADQPWIAEAPPGPEIWIGATIDYQGLEVEVERVGLLVFIDRRADDDYDQVVAEITDDFRIKSQTETTVGGAPAVLIESEPVGAGRPLDSFGTIPSPPDDEELGEMPAFASGDGEEYRFYIIDAPAGTLIVVIGIDPSTWDTLAPYWDEVIESIQFTS